MNDQKKGENIIRIAMIGPESTGKSTLCEKLALHFNTVWVPEFSREYIGSLNRPYTSDDVFFTIQMQSEMEKIYALKANKIIFNDNETINGKVWMLDRYNDYPEWIDEEIQNNPFDLYLLTYPDTEFIPDNVRENGDRRMEFYEWYKKELEANKLNFEIIKGQGDERVNNCFNEIRKITEK